jgi:hypothetical protein
MPGWSKWKPYPDPQKCGMLTAPLGPGVYGLRNIRTGKLVLCGQGRCLALRMTSLLPFPLGAGTRRNSEKRRYVLENMADIEYRVFACDTAQDAKQKEQELLRGRRDYLFPT